MRGWWHRYPEEYEAEINGLNSLGLRWSKDEDAFQRGVLLVNIDYQLQSGNLVSLKASYPDSFPYFPPSVELPELIFHRHQNPTGKNLCLLARDGEAWRPGVDTLALLIQQQLPRLESVNQETAAPDFVADEEDHAGEPLSNFLRWAQESLIVVPDDLPPRDVLAGRIRLELRDIPANVDHPVFITGVVRTISDLSGTPLVSFSVKTPAFTKESSGFWMRIEERPDISESKEPTNIFLSKMENAIPAFSRAVQSAKRGQVIIAGFTYQDEISWRKQADDWVFIALRVRIESKGARSAQCDAVFIRADWGGEQAWLSRAPFLYPVRSKSVLVVGLGSLGSPLVMQLAKAGVGEMHLVDCDQLQVGNTIRWAMGWRYAGLLKVRALCNQIAIDYPYTKVSGASVRLGDIPGDPKIQTDYELICALARTADLIIDATASLRVSHFLADLCREIGKNYLWLTTTPACSGGVVGRIRPSHTGGCWSCFQRGLADGKIQSPADWGAEEIQPGGCSQPTFIGAGVDSDEVAILGSRLAVATLCAGIADGYPDFDWDVAVGDFREQKKSLAPTWTCYQLERNESCGACQVHEDSLDQ